MDNVQMITIIASILIPTLGGLAWIIHQIGDLKTRVSVIETILAMMGAPIKGSRNKQIEP